ncbi:MAG: hypothetical protein ACTSV2_12770, partial [Candidatus Thorarchaeota archaeon]
MMGKLISRSFCICIIAIIVGSPFFAITPISIADGDGVILDADTNKDNANLLDNVFSPTQTVDTSIEEISTNEKDTWLDDDPFEANFPLDMFQRYGRYPSGSDKYTTEYYVDHGSGLSIEYHVTENHLFITMTVGSYDCV